MMDNEGEFTLGTILPPRGAAVPKWTSQSIREWERQLNPAACHVAGGICFQVPLGSSDIHLKKVLAILPKPTVRRIVALDCSSCSVRLSESERNETLHRNAVSGNLPLARFYRPHRVPAPWLFQAEHLQQISLRRCLSLTNVSLSMLSRHCKNLLRLDIAGCTRVTSEGVENLPKGLPLLEELDVSHCVKVAGKALAWTFVSDSTIRCLRAAGLPGLDDEMMLAAVRRVCSMSTYASQMRNKKRVFRRRGDLVINSPSCPRILNAGSSTRLMYVDLSSCSLISDVGLLAVHRRTFAEVTTLKLRGIEGITRLGVSHLLKAMRKIICLDLKNCKSVGGDEVIECIRGKIQELQYLDVQGTLLESRAYLFWVIFEAPQLHHLGVELPSSPLLQEAHSIAKALSSIERLHSLSLGGHMMACAAVTEKLTALMRTQHRRGFPNWARKKGARASQSSTPMLSRRGAELAVNGSTIGIYGESYNAEDATTTMTELENSAWWEIDLGGLERVGFIRVYLPEQDPGLSLQIPFWVMISASPFATKCKAPSRTFRARALWSTRIGALNPASDSCRVLEVKVPDAPLARYIRIQQEVQKDEDGAMMARPLSLAEVQVIGLRLVELRIDVNNNNNRQKHGTASSSSSKLKENFPRRAKKGKKNPTFVIELVEVNPHLETFDLLKGPC